MRTIMRRSADFSRGLHLLHPCDAGLRRLQTRRGTGALAAPPPSTPAHPRARTGLVHVVTRWTARPRPGPGAAPVCCAGAPFSVQTRPTMNRPRAYRARAVLLAALGAAAC